MKNKNWKVRAMALGMSTVMLCGATPVFAQDVQSQDQIESGVENDQISGKCGENAVWTYDKTTHTLVISGSGPMFGGSQQLVPWSAKPGVEMYEIPYTLGSYDENEVEKVQIKEGITSIGDSAFYHYSNLKEVEMADTVTRIGVTAFSRCSSLETITLGKGVTTIGAQAFFDSGLKEMQFSENVSEIGAHAFSDTAWFANQLRQSPAVMINGTLIALDTDDQDVVTIPDGVTRIAADTFKGYNMTEVILPEGMKTIDSCAFMMCSLKKITIPDSVTQIDDYAFFLAHNVTIYGTEGSYAQTYAKEQNIPFVDINAKQESVIKVNKTQNVVYGIPSFSLQAKLKTGDGRLTYKSSNKNVATVNAQGEVNVKGCGITTITVNAAETDQFAQSHEKVILTVRPKKQTVSVKAATGKKLTIHWKKDTFATGYQVQYSTDKNFKKNVKSKTIQKNTTKSEKVTNLKAGKKYFTRVRAYKDVRFVDTTRKLCGDWSTVKSVTVKK